MFRTKNLALKALPYVISCVAGAGFYFLGLLATGDFRNLLMNISAALLAIPVILFFYEIVKSVSERRLNKEIFEYGKMQVDREAMGIVHQLMKIFYPLETIDFTFKNINKFMSLSKDEIRNVLKSNEYFGFQVLRSWDAYEENLENVLKNSFVVQKLDNDQVIAIIALLKSIRGLDAAQKAKGMFIATGKKETRYKLVRGEDINPENTKHPDRYLLLKHLKENYFQVIDAPDIPKYNEEKAFYTFTLNSEGLDYFTEVVADLITEVNNWVAITGNEFLVDTKMFRLGYRNIKV